MSLAPPVAVSRAAFNPLPIYIVLFCLLWSFAFVASKVGVTLLPVRFKSGWPISSSSRLICWLTVDWVR